MSGTQANRSVGAAKLAQKGDMQSLSVALGWPASTIGSYLSGQRRPGPARRKEIAELYPDVEPAMWDVLPIAAATPVEPEPQESLTAMPPTGQAVNDLARRLTRQARRAMQQLETTTAIDPLVFGRQIDSLAATIVKLGKFAGMDLTERQILDSPRWRVIERTVVRALEPWPDAQRAVADELRGLGGDD